MLRLETEKGGGKKKEEDGVASVRMGGGRGEGAEKACGMGFFFAATYALHALQHVCAARRPRYADCRRY